ncbi:MAG: carboxylating nicotinate-nucleotide diphosphorylase [Candidatus Dormibacteraeota bacterium]|nr:carboxylating nicotinate-nucleotide diphosphorylase [Candidatus Dormibacteraeota bacterium]
MQINRFMIRPVVEQGLREELGPGDTTGGFLVDEDLIADAQIYVKKPAVVCGLLLADESIRTLDPEAEVVHEVRDGDEVPPGQVLLRIRARAWALFAVERVALDWIQHLSGVATKTRRYVRLVEPYGVRVTDTRKGVPGIRFLHKYAVRMGGAHNHLFGLHNCILVKDNHIKVAGGIGPAVAQLRARAQHTFKIEVECETHEQVREALEAGAEVVMFDNMGLDEVREGVRLVGGRALTEASGSVREDTIVPIAQTGVDVISVGDLTHSVAAVDASLDVGEIKPSARRDIALALTQRA